MYREHHFKQPPAHEGALPPDRSSLRLPHRRQGRFARRPQTASRWRPRRLKLARENLRKSRLFKVLRREAAAMPRRAAYRTADRCILHTGKSCILLRRDSPLLKNCLNAKINSGDPFTALNPDLIPESAPPQAFEIYIGWSDPSFSAFLSFDAEGTPLCAGNPGARKLGAAGRLKPTIYFSVSDLAQWNEGHLENLMLDVVNEWHRELVEKRREFKAQCGEAFCILRKLKKRLARLAVLDEKLLLKSQSLITAFKRRTGSAGAADPDLERLKEEIREASRRRAAVEEELLILQRKAQTLAKHKLPPHNGKRLGDLVYDWEQAAQELSRVECLTASQRESPKFKEAFAAFKNCIRKALAKEPDHWSGCDEFNLRCALKAPFFTPHAVWG